jgi:hypothetical protein
MDMGTSFPDREDPVGHLEFKRFPAGETLILDRQVNVVSFTAAEASQDNKQ